MIIKQLILKRKVIVLAALIIHFVSANSQDLTITNCLYIGAIKEIGNGILISGHTKDDSTVITKIDKNKKIEWQIFRNSSYDYFNIYVLDSNSFGLITSNEINRTKSVEIINKKGNSVAIFTIPFLLNVKEIISFTNYVSILGSEPDFGKKYRMGKEYGEIKTMSLENFVKIDYDINFKEINKIILFKTVWKPICQIIKNKKNIYLISDYYEPNNDYYGDSLILHDKSQHIFPPNMGDCIYEFDSKGNIVRNVNFKDRYLGVINSITNETLVTISEIPRQKFVFKRINNLLDTANQLYLNIYDYHFLSKDTVIYCNKISNNKLDLISTFILSKQSILKNKPFYSKSINTKNDYSLRYCFLSNSPSIMFWYYDKTNNFQILKFENY
jgi:hypothetical protein